MFSLQSLYDLAMAYPLLAVPLTGFLASLTHGKLPKSPLTAGALKALATLAGPFNAPLARQVAVDVSKAILLTWDTPKAVQAPEAPAPSQGAKG